MRIESGHTASEIYHAVHLFQPVYDESNATCTNLRHMYWLSGLGLTEIPHNKFRYVRNRV